MTLEEKQQEIIEEFAVFEDQMDKYEYIMELGRDVPLIDEHLKTDDRLIPGCLAKVWLDAKIENGVMNFSADSNSDLVKGVITLLIRVLNNEKPEVIATADLYFIKEIGLQELFTQRRSNGLVNMTNKLKMCSIVALSKM